MSLLIRLSTIPHFDSTTVVLISSYYTDVLIIYFILFIYNN